MDIASLSLIVSIVGIPTVYYLGCRSARHATYNNLIVDLEKINQTTFELSLDILKEKEFDMSNYHLMISYVKRTQRHIEELNKIGKIGKTKRIDTLFISTKQILTSTLMEGNPEIKKNCIPELIINLDLMNAFYVKKFI